MLTLTYQTETEIHFNNFAAANNSKNNSFDSICRVKVKKRCVMSVKAVVLVRQRLKPPLFTMAEFGICLATVPHVLCRYVLTPNSHICRHCGFCHSF